MLETQDNAKMEVDSLQIALAKSRREKEHLEEEKSSRENENAQLKNKLKKMDRKVERLRREVVESMVIYHKQKHF